MECEKKYSPKSLDPSEFPKLFGVYTPTWYTHGATCPIFQAFSGVHAWKKMKKMILLAIRIPQAFRGIHPYMVYTWGHMSYFPSFFGDAPLHGIHMAPQVILYTANCTQPTAHGQLHTANGTLHSQPYTANRTQQDTPTSHQRSAFTAHHRCWSLLVAFASAFCFCMLLLHVASAFSPRPLRLAFRRIASNTMFSS